MLADGLWLLEVVDPDFPYRRRLFIPYGLGDSQRVEGPGEEADRSPFLGLVLFIP